MKTKINKKELFNLDITIAEFILPRLIAFKNASDSYPGDLSRKKWEKILDKMIVAFEIISKDSDYFLLNNKKKIKQLEEGLDLFKKHIGCLWI